MIRCTVCLLDKEAECFALKSIVAGKRQPACRECRKQIDRVYWEKNKHRKQAVKRENHRKWSKERSDWLNEQKNRPCADCGIKYPPCVMDFDHLRDKEFTIASFKLNLSKEILLAEIAKCQVVCANCHRIRTHIGA